MLRPTQEPCVNRCFDKFLKLSARVGQRFAEQNVLLQQQAPAASGSTA